MIAEYDGQEGPQHVHVPLGRSLHQPAVSVGGHSAINEVHRDLISATSIHSRAVHTKEHAELAGSVLIFRGRHRCDVRVIDCNQRNVSESEKPPSGCGLSLRAGTARREDGGDVVSRLVAVANRVPQPDSSLDSPQGKAVSKPGSHEGSENKAKAVLATFSDEGSGKTRQGQCRTLVADAGMVTDTLLYPWTSAAAADVTAVTPTIVTFSTPFNGFGAQTTARARSSNPAWSASVRIWVGCPPA